MAADASGAGYSAAFSLIGTYLQVQASREMGKVARIHGERAQAMSQFEAWEAERRAGIAISISQRQAMEEERQGRFVASRALAVAAASGAGVSDPTMVRVIANARGEGAVRAATDLYEGEARSRQLRTEAAMGRLSGSEAAAEGAAKEEAMALASLGTTAKEGLSLYSKYGMRGPGSGDAALIKDQVSGQYSTANVQYG